LRHPVEELTTLIARAVEIVATDFKCDPSTAAAFLCETPAQAVKRPAQTVH
jgi:hypothetical protein